MRKWLLGAAVVILVLAVGAAAFFFWPARLPEVSEEALAGMSEEEILAHGERVAIEADCAACHTSEGGRPYAGGLAFALPFGTIYSPNITPDDESGLGRWTEAEFLRAMRHGIGRDGQNLYPAFPYTSYTLMTDRDILALYYFIQSMEPVGVENGPGELSFPFNQRWGLRAWNLLFHEAGPYEPDPEQSEEWNRGAYLVEGAGHCGECHTPRNLFFARNESRGLAGAIVQGWNAYNITMHEDGIGSWTEEQLISYLSTGHAEGRGAASGTMAEAVDLSLRHLPETDIRAMVTYLRSVEAVPDENPKPVETEPALVEASAPFGPPAAEEEDGHMLGLKLFREFCASCHAWDGSGQQSPYASLLGSQTVNDPAGTNLMQVIIRGTSLHSELGREFMPAFGGALSNTEIAALSNYVLAHFGGKEGQVTPEDVERAREAGH